MKRRVTSLVLAVFCAFLLCSCYSSKQAKAIEKEAVSVIDWLKKDLGLKSGDDVADVDFVTTDYSGNPAISVDALKTLRYAKYFKIDADYDKTYENLEDAFEEIYPDKNAAASAPFSTLCYIALFLEETGKDTASFCSYDIDLIKLGAYENTSLAGYFDLYNVPVMLEVLKGKTVPAASANTPVKLIETLSEKQDENGGWGYEDWQTGVYSTDVDTTAAILGALALYYDDIFAAKTAGQKAEAYLKTCKNPDGTYKSSYSDKSSSSTAVVLCACARLAKEPFGDKNADILKTMEVFKNSDGGYKSGIEDLLSDRISTGDTLKLLYEAHVFYKTK